MKTTNDYLDAVKAKMGIDSDYALARAWNVTKQRIYEYRRGTTAFSDDKALEVADYLGIDRAQVLLSIQAERASKMHKPALRATLEEALRRLGGVAAVLALFILPPPPQAQAAPGCFNGVENPTQFDNNIHYAHYIGWLMRLGAVATLAINFIFTLR